jgi:hypothetical protein
LLAEDPAGMYAFAAFETGADEHSHGHGAFNAAALPADDGGARTVDSGSEG